MPLPRVSIAGLLVVVVVCGVGVAALKEASGYWASAMVTATIGVLLAAILGACKGRHRSAWLGFAVFGWGYFAVGVGPWFASDVRPHLLTSVAIAEAYNRMHAKTSPRHANLYPHGPAEDTGGLGWPGFGGQIDRDIPVRFVTVIGAGPAAIATAPNGRDYAVWGEPDYFAFERSAHCLLALISGGLGAVLAGWFERRATADRSEREELR